MFKKSMESIGKVVVFFLLVLSCSFLFKLDVRADSTFSFMTTDYVVPSLHVTDGVPVVYETSFPTMYSVDDLGSYHFVFYLNFGLALTNPDDGLKTLVDYPSFWFNDVYCVINGVRHYADYRSAGVGLYMFAFDADISAQTFGHITFYADVVQSNRIITSNLDAFFSHQLTVSVTTSAWSIVRNGIQGDIVHDSTQTSVIQQGQQQAHQDMSSQTSVIQQGQQQAHQDMSSQTSVIQQGQQQAHQDMDKVNDSLTNFSGSGALDTSKGQLDGVISDYDKVEGSLFDSGQAAFDKFDPSTFPNFSAGIASAVGYISRLMVGIISAMGEFSVLYTVGMFMVFFGVLVGLWRFFR